MLKRVVKVAVAATLAVSLSIGAFADTVWTLDNFKRNRTYSDSTFSDIKADAWYAGAVKDAYELGLMEGSGGKFNPDNKITVRESVVLASKIHSIFVHDNYDFSGGTTWDQKFLDYAKDNYIYVPNLDLGSSATRVVFAHVLCTALPASALEAINNVTEIPDIEKTDWHYSYILKLYNAGIISGQDDYGTFKPKDTITRKAVASIVSKMADKNLRSTFTLKEKVEEVETYVPSTVSGPDKPTSTNTTVQNINQNGAFGISFDPAAFKADLVLANGSFFTSEAAQSIVNRTNAAVAFNGAFFNSYTPDCTTWSSIIKDGKALLIDNANPDKPYFVIDSKGKASIQHMTIKQTARIVRNGAYLDGAGLTFDDVGCNFQLGDKDGSRMIFTPEFGAKAPGKFKCAAICDKNGVVKQVINSTTAQEITIPKDGFVLCERYRRDETSDYKWEKFFDTVKAGDTIALSLSYEGSTVQDIVTAFACGPTVVKNGKAYGNHDTYVSEGFTEDKIISWTAGRTCLGVKSDGTVVVICASANMAGLSKIMLDLGCVDAMNLDGGASSAIYVNGTAKVAAGRQLSHMMIFTLG